MLRNALQEVPALPLITAAFVGFSVCPASAAPVPFHDQVIYPAGQMPAAIAAEDLDGDAFPDIVVANILSQDISVFMNRMDGTFDDEVRLDAGGRARSVAVGRLDDDAAVDIAVGLQESSDCLAVFLNDGQGGFSGPFLYGSPRVTNYTVITDVDGDTDGDVVQSRLVSDLGEIAVYFNDGNGGFDDVTVYAIDPDAFTGGVAAGDLDRDEDNDLVAVFAYSNEAPIRLVNDGDGSFTEATPFNMETTVTPGVNVADFNGDQAEDIVAISGGIRIYLNDGSGDFGNPLIHDPQVLLSSASRIGTGDFDRDGAIDLVIPGGLSDMVGVLRNDGDGHLIDEGLHATGSYARDVVAADLDGDTWPDIAVANRDGHSISVLLNASGSASVQNPSSYVRRLGPPVPNPSRSTVSAALRTDAGVRNRVAVYDAAGRMLRVLLDATPAGDRHEVVWDLTDGSGRPVAPGMYLLRLDAAGLRDVGKVVVLR